MYARQFIQKPTLKTAKATIEEVKYLLFGINQENKSAFLLLLKDRIDEFEIAIQQQFHKNSDESQLIIEQYNRFALALRQCISRPKNTDFFTKNYQNSAYYPVGITVDTTKPKSTLYNSSLATAILGAALVLVALAAFASNPLFGAILLPIALTMLAPSCAVLLSPEPVDTSAKKLEEKIIFQMGAKLIDPKLVFTQDEESDAPLHRRAI